MNGKVVLHLSLRHSEMGRSPDNVNELDEGAKFMNRSCYLTLGIFLSGMVVTAGAQQPVAAAPEPPPLVGTIAAHPDWPAAKNHPSDVDTVDHLLSSLYEVISGAAGKPRDWDRFRSLF